MNIHPLYRSTTVTVICAFLTLVCCLAAPSIAFTQNVIGYVAEDAYSSGLEGATVTFTNAIGAESAMTATKDGHFSTVLSNGVYTVKASFLPDYPEASWAGEFDSLAGAMVTTITVPPGNSSVHIFLHHNQAMITGVVSDSVTLLPIVGAIVMGESMIGGDNWSEKTNGVGVYSTQVNTGEYDVRATAWGYAPSHFGSIVLVTGANTRSLSLTKLPLISISGTVRGDAGEPIAGAIVKVYSASADYFTWLDFETQTNISGYYAFTVPAGTATCLDVFASGYYTDDCQSPIATDSNLTVNFTMMPLPPDPTRLSGRILDCSGNNLYAPGTVYAYPIVAGVVHDSPVRMSVDSGNYFEIWNLAVGSYYLWFLPDDNAHYCPDYYSSPSCTGNWMNARAVAVYASQTITGLDIRVQNVGVPSGPYTVLGTITVLLPAIREVPLDSVRVYARDSMGMLLAYATTDKNGHFAIANLPRGMYYLSVDRIGYKVVVKDSVVDLTSLTKMTDTADFKVLEPGSTVGVATQSDLPASLALHENYPNPFAGSTTMSFATDHSGSVVLDVRDVLGRIVSTIVNGTLPQGEHSVEFIAANLPAGVYFTRLASAGRAVVKTMVVKK